MKMCSCDILYCTENITAVVLEFILYVVYVFDIIYIFLAENIPRTLQGVYQRARMIFSPKYAAKW